MDVYTYIYILMRHVIKYIMYFYNYKKSSISLICTCLKRISCSYTQFFIEWKYRFPVFCIISIVLQ